MLVGDPGEQRTTDRAERTRRWVPAGPCDPPGTPLRSQTPVLTHLYPRKTGSNQRGEQDPMLLNRLNCAVLPVCLRVRGRVCGTNMLERLEIKRYSSPPPGTELRLLSLYSVSPVSFVERVRVTLTVRETVVTLKTLLSLHKYNPPLSLVSPSRHRLTLPRACPERRDVSQA